MSRSKWWLVGLFLLNLVVAHAFEVGRMSCELAESPLTVTATHPRFGWQIRAHGDAEWQTAYQIELYKVTDEGELLCWDSGVINSGQSQLVTYDGDERLKPGSKYSWRVRVWNEKGEPSAWSRMERFRTAPSPLTMNADWIGAISRQDARLPMGRRYHSTVMKRPENRIPWQQVDPASGRSIYLRQTFASEKAIREAVAYVCGLGHYEFTLNGSKVGDSEFAPLISDYDKTVYYNCYDVTDYLKQGQNAIGVLLGNGFYNVQGGRYYKLLVSFGPPTLFFKMIITYQDGSVQEINSNEEWKQSESPVTFNCIYGGEDYDATREQPGWDTPDFNDEEWSPVVVQGPPSGMLRPQQTTPVRVMERYKAKSVRRLTNSRCVMDMGQNLAGFPEIVVAGQQGDTIRLTVGESLNEDGTVSQKQTGSKHYYQYVLKGEGDERWHPRFSYYGFRYIQVDLMTKEGEGKQPLPELKEIVSCFIYNAAEKISSFNSSNSIFNNAHRIIGNAVRSNMQGVFTDCPHREKLGWLEQVHLNGPGLYYNYDLRTFIPKVMQDISDAQLPNGLVPSIAPEYVTFEGAFRDSPEWGGASVMIPWMYYLYYGDDSLLRNYYDVMKRYVDYLSTRATNHIVSHGLGDWYDYHGERAGFSKNTPVPLVATAHYYHYIDLLTRTAEMLGNKEDAARYGELLPAVKKAFNNTFFHAETNQYGTGSQASNAIPLFFDLVEPAKRKGVLDNLVRDIRQKGNRLSTGDVGNRYLFQTLARNDLNELMYLMHNHEEVPGYGFQVRFGATTLTEQWDPRQGTSWNHFMMGQIDEWFFASLAGIRPDPDHPGFRKFIIQPQVVGDLTHVNASTETLYGRIAVAWKRENNRFTLDLEVPVNSEATVILPDKRTFVVAGGTHTFSAKL